MKTYRSDLLHTSHWPETDSKTFLREKGHDSHLCHDVSIRHVQIIYIEFAVKKQTSLVNLHLGK